MQESSKRLLWLYALGEEAHRAGVLLEDMGNRGPRGVAAEDWFGRRGLTLDKLSYLSYTGYEFLRAGAIGRAMPVWVTGWRYGGLPRDREGDVRPSYNYRDQQPERGVSLVAVDGGAPCRSFAVLEAKKRGVVRVGGFLVEDTGSDGEPLVVGAVELPACRPSRRR